MTDATFKATFEDFQLIKGRKVCKIVLEVPIEAADAALKALGGVPRPDQSVWVAVARLDTEAASKPKKPGKRHWDEIPLAEQAGVRCCDPAFKEWLFFRDEMGGTPWADYDVKEHLRKICGIQSRRQIRLGTEAGKIWKALDEEFRKVHGLIAEKR